MYKWLSSYSKIVKLKDGKEFISFQATVEIKNGEKIYVNFSNTLNPFMKLLNGEITMKRKYLKEVASKKQEGKFFKVYELGKHVADDYKSTLSNNVEKQDIKSNEILWD